MSDTPRTDSFTENFYISAHLRSAPVVFADFARELEQELAQRTAEVEKANAERDEARREICNVVGRGQGKRLYAAERGWDCFAPHATDVRVQNGGE